MRRFSSRTLSALAVASVVALSPVGGSRFAPTVFASQDNGKAAPPAPAPAPKTPTDTPPEPPKPTGTPAATPDVAKAQANADSQANSSRSATSLLAGTQDLMSGFLHNALTQNPTMGADDLKKKGRDQLTSLLALFANDPNAKLAPNDVSVIEALAHGIFTSFKPVPPVVTPPAAVQIPPPALQGLITGDIRVRLKASLTTVCQTYKQTQINNPNFARTPSPQEQKDFLMLYAQHKPTLKHGSGIFLDDYMNFTNHNVIEYSQLSAADKQSVEDMIKEVVDGTVTPVEPPIVPPIKPPDPLVNEADMILHIVGDLFPQFAPLEPLAEGAVNHLIPVIERWRPLQRLRSRFGRRGVMLDSGGSDYVPVSQSSRSRYIIVNPE